MGAYPTDRYQIEIIYRHFWEYIPFRKKEVVGREATIQRGRDLVAKGYKLVILTYVNDSYGGTRGITGCDAFSGNRSMLEEIAQGLETVTIDKSRSAIFRRRERAEE